MVAQRYSRIVGQAIDVRGLSNASRHPPATPDKERLAERV